MILYYIQSEGYISPANISVPTAKRCTGGDSCCSEDEVIIVIIIKIIIITQDESIESTTVNLSAIYDIMFMEPCQFEQYNEELEECNT